jgi:hypothetical protein
MQIGPSASFFVAPGPATHEFSALNSTYRAASVATGAVDFFLSTTDAFENPRSFNTAEESEAERGKISLSALEEGAVGELPELSVTAIESGL